MQTVHYANGLSAIEGEGKLSGYFEGWKFRLSLISGMICMGKLSDTLVTTHRTD